MNSEIINIGTELILGQTINTNAKFIAEKLSEHGINCFFQSSVGDNLSRVTSIIKSSLDRSDLVITTGGLGSTDDDITREAIAEASGRKLISKPYLKRIVQERVDDANIPVTDRTLKQAYIPETAESIRPQKGTAPGIILRIGEKTLVALPGVPEEAELMMDESVIPYILKNHRLSENVIISRTLKCYGLKEAEVEEHLRDLIKSQENPTMAILLDGADTNIRLTADASSANEALDLIKAIEIKAKERLGLFFYGVDDENMETVVGRLLEAHQLSIGCAESITAGLVSSRLVNIEGSSSYFAGSIISYSNHLKNKLLDVSAQSILSHGAVSPIVAEEMASQVRSILEVDIGISSTGIAGPEGGTKKKPIGLVYFGLSTHDSMIVDRVVFYGCRNVIRWKASQYLLNMVRLYLIEKTGESDESA